MYIYLIFLQIATWITVNMKSMHLHLEIWIDLFKIYSKFKPLKIQISLPVQFFSIEMAIYTLLYPLGL